ncbi:conserved hypothetical protein [Bathymodiolus platifrons methanotrophic gill symbiont]|uniref:hypothetical protein n=1 Tax=Bathymodiolus platifrons methanotrophic gill symbiont TaxID=113268 RepID=UPI000B6BC073|nr:hypothetical protein [Bathymodiolus platifrons methanotrophic gill symbiont]GAW86911.1 conserved hypothetical protein [Bathymodiolus platifrons methanotrophic gill symbiont]GFO75814.1 hypothetical protein BPLS_P3244 [Bathymodiolus platifrons methanotrophic gill symbiont]
MTSSNMRKSFIALLGMLFSATLWAHGGAAGTDTDQCKFELEPEHWIHYTAYQPLAFPAEEFCGNLPDTDTLTQLVFDYQDVRYRNRAVEFEVTKEPEGKRVFFQAAKKHKSGTVVLKLPNGIPEPGKYLIHITLRGATEADNLDAHMSFVAGQGMVTSSTSLFMYFLFLLAGLYVLYLSHAGFKAKVDELLAKAKKV